MGLPQDISHAPARSGRRYYTKRRSGLPLLADPERWRVSMASSGHYNTVNRDTRGPGKAQTLEYSWRRKVQLLGVTLNDQLQRAERRAAETSPRRLYTLARCSPARRVHELLEDGINGWIIEHLIIK